MCFDQFRIVWVQTAAEKKNYFREQLSTLNILSILCLCIRACAPEARFPASREHRLCRSSVSGHAAELGLIHVAETLV